MLIVGFCVITMCFSVEGSKFRRYAVLLRLQVEEAAW